MDEIHMSAPTGTFYIDPASWGVFRPVAFFDDRLDCIRVITRDCSVLEERINSRITVLIDNYPPSPEQKYVGFTFKGARHLCSELGWSLDMPLTMSQLLDGILKTCPGSVVEWFIEKVARPLSEADQIEHVEMRSPATQPAFAI